MERNEIQVNHNYQRSSRVWPPAARSFLMETILLGYPMPKLSLFQNTDVKSRTTIKEIVDGQQRSVAIYDFYRGQFAISRTSSIESIAGRTYNELDETQQHGFLSYALSVDLFINATHEDIREVFRRMNSYTVPLNAEEKRHAHFQGEFKWFIYRLSKRFDEIFQQIGTFNEKQLNRMKDANLLADVANSLLRGISTTKSRELDRLYAMYETGFDKADDIASAVVEAIDQVVHWTALHKTALTRAHNLYALLLALINRRRVFAPLREIYTPQSARIKDDIALANLTRLAAAVEDPDTEPRVGEFVAAQVGTNVGEARRRRFLWLSRALEPELL